MQVVMGCDYPEATISNLSGLYTTWAGGLLAWPFIDLPWTPFGKAVRAKQQLLDWFQVRALQRGMRRALAAVYVWLALATAGASAAAAAAAAGLVPGEAIGRGDVVCSAGAIAAVIT
jgi:hypothetical protein